MPKFIISQTRTSQFQAEIEAENEDEVWEALHNDEIELDFLESDDEFVVYTEGDNQNG
jgi:hypothetical protein